MLYTVSSRLISTISAHLIRCYLPERMRKLPREQLCRKDLHFFSKGVAELSYYFTVARSALSSSYFNYKEYRSAYILYFIIPNFLKVQFCLSQYCRTGCFGGTIDVLDIGCGPGTASMACIDFFKGASLRIWGLDCNRKILGDAVRLVASFSCGKARFVPVLARSSRKGLVVALGRRRFDLIILSNFINEIKKMEQRHDLVKFLFRNYLKVGGGIIIVEPALRHTSRSLMALRDGLLEDVSEMRVVAPCLHSMPCPMIRWNRRDWCHMYLDWERPFLVEELDALLGFKKDYLKFSYLVLAEGAGSHPDCIWRVVSSPLRSKGKVQLLVCNWTGLRKLTRLDRHRSKGNDVMDKLQRGDVIKYEGKECVSRESTIILLPDGVLQ